VALFPGLPRWAGTRKVKQIWILLKHKTVSGSGSGISWAICKSAPRSRQITTSAPHHSSFLQARCPSCRPTNSVKAQKAIPGTGIKKVALMHYTPSLRSLGWMKNKRVIWPPGTQQRPFYSHYTGQPALASTWMSLLVQSFTARMSSLTTTCTCGLGRRS